MPFFDTPYNQLIAKFGHGDIAGAILTCIIDGDKCHAIAFAPVPPGEINRELNEGERAYAQKSESPLSLAFANRESLGAVIGWLSHIAEHWDTREALSLIPDTKCPNREGSHASASE